MTRPVSSESIFMHKKDAVDSSYTAAIPLSTNYYYTYTAVPDTQK